MKSLNILELEHMEKARKHSLIKDADMMAERTTHTDTSVERAAKIMVEMKNSKQVREQLTARMHQLMLSHPP